MDLFLSHRTALEYWQSAPGAQLLAEGRFLRTQHAGVGTCSVPKRALLANALADSAFQGAPLSQPVHVMVGRDSQRRSFKGVRCHVASGRLPKGSFVRVSDSVLMASPEFVFVQMAKQYDVISMIRLGFQLCGGYAESRLDRRGFIDLPPRTTAAKLLRFALRASSVDGAKVAQRAAKCVLDGSASPAETELAMLLCLPRMMGGHGAPPPRMNGLVKRQHGSSGRLLDLNVRSESYYKCDLLWVECGFGLEYDSFAEHSGRKKEAHDSERRASLGMESIEVMSVLPHQLYAAQETEKLARIVMKKLGLQYRELTLKQKSKRVDLRRALLE